MRITIAMGFFLPVPPAAGGATEKIWLRLGEEFAAQGHAVTIVSRTWQNWPTREETGRLAHLRLPGANHRRRLWQNLALDLRWSLRLRRALPPADITISHPIALPWLLGWSRGHAGKLVVVTGRMPKGQYRWYHSVDQVLATSSAVRDRVRIENPALAARTIVRGNPIDWQALAAGSARQTQRVPPTIGYVGRLHREKGLDLLAAAASDLAAESNLPAFNLLLCGPAAIAVGGSGDNYVAALEGRLRAALPNHAIKILPPIFDARQLADLYRQIDIFCYPSIAAEGETFGVSAAEAMAAGAATVVSELACFRDFIVPEKNGLVFDHTGADAPARLAQVLARLVRAPEERVRLGSQAQADVQRYDYPRFAENLLVDFQRIIAVRDAATAADPVLHDV